MKVHAIVERVHPNNLYYLFIICYDHKIVFDLFVLYYVVYVRELRCLRL